MSHPTEPLVDAIERARKDYLASLSTKKRLMRQFTDGVVKGLGMALGGTIVFGVLIYLIGRFVIAPEAKNWIFDLQQQAAELQNGFFGNDVRR